MVVVRFIMNSNDVNKIIPQSAEEWRDLLEKTRSQGKDNVGHKYIVLDNEEGKFDAILSSEFTNAKGKVSVAEIVKTSQERINALKKSVTKQGFLTDEQITKFSSVSSNIATYTESIIEARKNKRELSKLQRGIALVLCCLAVPLFGLGVYLGHKILQGNKKFEKEILDLKENVRSMRQEIQDLKEKKIHLDVKLFQQDFGYDEHFSRQLLNLEEYIPQQIDLMHELKAKIGKLEKENQLSGKQVEELTQLRSQLEQVRQDVKSYVDNIEDGKLDKVSLKEDIHLQKKTVKYNKLSDEKAEQTLEVLSEFDSDFNRSSYYLNGECISKPTGDHPHERYTSYQTIISKLRHKVENPEQAFENISHFLYQCSQAPLFELAMDKQDDKNLFPIVQNVQYFMQMNEENITFSIPLDCKYVNPSDLDNLDKIEDSYISIRRDITIPYEEIDKNWENVSIAKTMPKTTVKTYVSNIHSDLESCRAEIPALDRSSEIDFSKSER